MHSLHRFWLLAGLILLASGAAWPQTGYLTGALTYQRTWSGEDTADEKTYAGNYTILYNGELNVAVKPAATASAGETGAGRQTD